MTEEQFKLAIKGLRMKAKNKEIAYRLFVSKESRKRIMEETGIQNAYISQLIARISKNFSEQLDEHDLICREWVIHKDTAPLIEVIEREHLRQYLDEKNKKRKRKVLPVEGSSLNSAALRFPQEITQDEFSK